VPLAIAAATVAVLLQGGASHAQTARPQPTLKQLVAQAKKLSNEVKEEQFHRIERRYGAFSRSFSLPQTVDATKVAAEYKNGVLTVRLPLRDEAKPRQIKIDVAA